MKLAFALLLGIAACARAKSATPPMGPGGRHDPQIEALDRENEEALAKMQLTRPPLPAAMNCVPGRCPLADITPMSTKINITAAEDPSCKRAETETCTTACTLADSICKNARRICDLAGNLDNDAWANEKCATNTETCRVAHEKCCSCT